MRVLGGPLVKAIGLRDGLTVTGKKLVGLEGTSDDAEDATGGKQSIAGEVIGEGWWGVEFAGEEKPTNSNTA